MKFSTKSRYALRVMIELAERNDAYVPLKELAKSQNISLKYLESIMSLLTKHQLVQGLQGKGGGYKLTKDAEKYKISDILCVTEVSLAPVTCLECKVPVCDRNTTCKTLPMWERFAKMVRDYFDNISIKDLADSNLNKLNWLK